MFTSAHANRSAQASAPAGHYAHRSGEQNTNGLISEIVYREDQPMMTQLLLLPYITAAGSTVALAAVAHAATKAQPRMGSVRRSAAVQGHAN